MRFSPVVLLALLPLAFAGWTAFCGDMSCPNVAIDIVCSKPDRCYLAGGYSNTPMSVYTSADLSKWQLADVQGFTMMLTTIAAHPAGPVAAGGIGGGNFSAILASHDGNTFYNAEIPTPVFGQDLKAIGNDAVSPSKAALAFVGATVFDNKDVILFSIDGAASFLTVTMPDEIHDISPARYGSYPGADTWFVSGGNWPSTLQSVAEDSLNHCLRMSQHLCAPAGDMSPAAVKAFNSRRLGRGNGGYVGSVSKTTDGGKTWKMVYHTKDFYFNDISCSDENTCIAVGENASNSGIYRTEDGGETWEQVYGQSSTRLSSMFKVRFAQDGKTAFAAGGNADATGIYGIIAKSTDGGKTWAIDHKEPNVGLFMGLNISPDASFGAAVGLSMDQASVILGYTA